jgi:hypothetical protein
MIPIVFGYPSMEMFEASERGEIALRGCMVTGEDPTHRRATCGHDVIVDAVLSATTTCATCGLPLDGDPDEEFGGVAGLPICGDCRRNREFAAVEEVALWSDTVE